MSSNEAMQPARGGTRPPGALFRRVHSNGARRSPSTLIRAVVVAVLAGSVTARADNWDPNLTLTTTWNNNATNASLSTDEIGALQTEAVIIASERYSVGRADSLHPGLHFAGEWWPRFNGLLRGSAGARLEWRHKFGLGTLAPTFAVEAGVDENFTREEPRRGTSSHVNVSLRKRFNDQWRAAAWHEFAQHATRGPAFDRKGSETALEIGRDVTDVARVTLTLRYRDGDVLSYATPPRPDLVSLAPNSANVETFGRPMVAYSVNARTIAAKGAIIRAMDEASALILAYEYRETERTPLRYVNHLVSLALVHQF